jgi:Sel1 repeat
MCGDRLPDRPGNAEKRPTTAEMRAEDIARATERQERIAGLDPEPVAASLRHREPVDATLREMPPLNEYSALPDPVPVNPVPIEGHAPLPPAVADFYAARTAPQPPVEEPIEEPTTVGGPSFLGLSSGNGDSSYSYLYEDEQPKSHLGTLVFLLLLAVLAGIVYMKWQPIRDYVVNAALTHSQQGRTPQTPAPTEPGSTTASSDNAAANAAPQPNGKAPDANGLPQQDNSATPDQPKIETTQPKPKEAAPAPKEPETSNISKNERPRSEVGRNSSFQDVKGKGAADEDTPEESEKPSARRPTKPAGTELVDSGERYLYGRGVPRSCSQALVNFNAAAKQDNPKAMSHLGSLYATGQCVALNRAQAYQWFSRALAADRGNTYLEHNLNMLWRDMSATERAQATQRKMF